jgi:hypothetical protein
MFRGNSLAFVLLIGNLMQPFAELVLFFLARLIEAATQRD